MKIGYIIGGMVVGFLIGYFVFSINGPNTKREYGESGLPSNCRALIYETEADYYIYNEHSHEDLLKSIFRNCGETGYLWNE